jgi:hypothetical protein
MKRHIICALAAVIVLAASAFARHNHTPPEGYLSATEGPYGHPGSQPLRPVYQQPLRPPVSHGHCGGGCADGCGGDMGYCGCDSCGGGGYGDPCGDDYPNFWHEPLGMYGRVEYLLWWTDGQELPPLVTSATGTGTGILGGEDTVILFGGDELDSEERSGGRFTIGWWLDCEQCRALEANFWSLEESSDGFEVQSTGTPLISRPFFNEQLATNAVQVISREGISTGGVFVNTTSDVLGGEVLVRRKLNQTCYRTLDFLWGYRYARIKESLTIRDELTSIDPNGNVPVGTVVGGFDQFETSNWFHGFDIGFEYNFLRPRYTVGVLGKVALGSMHQDVQIGGSTFVAVPGSATMETAGGLLTQPSNLGGYERNEFAVVPEFGVSLKYQISCCLEASFGYTLLYFSDVARPGDQVDLRVDPRQITDPANATPFPAFTFADSDYWVQGINVGLELKF